MGELILGWGTFMKGLVVVFLVIQYPIGFYYLFFFLLRLMGFRNEYLPEKDPCTRFLILIPAHNEEVCISSTLESLKKVEYPKALWDAIVIADNCTDGTEKIVRDAGISCAVRFDMAKRGKGYALQWFFSQRVIHNFDAIVVLDADCLISSDSLAVLDAAYRQGEKAVQMNINILNPDDSVNSYAAAIGKCMEYELFYAPRSKLGLSTSLDAGHSISVQTLADVPYNSVSIVEDAEYVIKMALANNYVSLAANATAFTRGVTTKEQLSVQRGRWASGSFHLVKRWVPYFLKQGIRELDPRIFDFGVMLLVLSRPLVIAQSMLATAMAIGAALILPSGGWLSVAVISSVLSVGHLASMVWSAARIGMTQRRTLLLLRIPEAAFRMLLIAIKSLANGKLGSWNRTPR